MITGMVVSCGVWCRMESRLEQARETAVSQPLGVTLKMDLGWELEVGDEDGREQLSAYKASMAL